MNEWICNHVVNVTDRKYKEMKKKNQVKIQKNSLDGLVPLFLRTHRKTQSQHCVEAKLNVCHETGLTYHPAKASESCFLKDP